MNHASAGLFCFVAAVATAVACDGTRRQTPLPLGTPGFPSRPMTRTIHVQAAYDDTNMYLRVRFPASDPCRMQEYFHDVGGTWVREGGGFRDYAAALAGDTERGDTSRISAYSEATLNIAISDRQNTGTRVRDFERYGCFLACHERVSYMPNWRESDGDQDMHLFPGFGGFADLWSWRANRTGLAGYADDLSITAAGFIPDQGAAPYHDLQLGADGLPPFIFNPAQHGSSATATWDEVLAGNSLAFDDGTLDALPDALPSSVAVWTPADGQALPAQMLSRPTGSRANVAAAAVYSNGEWDLRLTRKLTTGDLTGDVAFVNGRPYDIAFSMHTDQADGRDHYVSLPVPLLVGTAGTGISAIKVAAAPDFSNETAIPVNEVEVFLPGVTSYDFVVGAVATREGAARQWDVKHGGAKEVNTSEKACADCHRVRQTDPMPPYRDAGAFENLVPRRGGVFGPTPFFESEGAQ